SFGRLTTIRRLAVCVAVLLVDQALDLLLQIRGHLHLVRILRVLGDLLEDLLVVLSAGHEIAVRSYVTAVEVLHGRAPGATAPPFPYARGPSKASGEGSARRAAGRAAQYRQLGYRLAGLAGEGTGEVLKPARRPRRSAEPGDAGGAARSLQLLRRAARLAHFAQPEISHGALERVEEAPPLGELAGDVQLRFFLA